MSENTKKTAEGKSKKRIPKKAIIIVAAALAAAAIVLLLLGQGLLDGITGGKPVKFNQLDKEKIPQTIEKDVIPEYRELERALGCFVDGKVYVVVTRGEKPTAGYDLQIEKMKLEKADGKTNLVVTALFKEPPEGKAVAQVETYPYKVAETELTKLPQTIELMTKFE